MSIFPAKPARMARDRRDTPRKWRWVWDGLLVCVTYEGGAGDPYDIAGHQYGVEIATDTADWRETIAGRGKFNDFSPASAQTYETYGFVPSAATEQFSMLAAATGIIQTSDGYSIAMGGYRAAANAGAWALMWEAYNNTGKLGYGMLGKAYWASNFDTPSDGVVAGVLRSQTDVEIFHSDWTAGGDVSHEAIAGISTHTNHADTDRIVVGAVVRHSGSSQVGHDECVDVLNLFWDYPLPNEAMARIVADPFAFLERRTVFGFKAPAAAPAGPAGPVPAKMHSYRQRRVG